jgi:hypothetical protein
MLPLSGSPPENSTEVIEMGQIRGNSLILFDAKRIRFYPDLNGMKQGMFA